MRSNLHVLILLSTFFLSVNCGCKTGFFTKSNPCDTPAILIPSSKFVSVDIAKGKWQYYYLPLKGLGDSFELTFKMDDPPLHVYINFQRADKYELPTSSYSDYDFEASDGDRTIPLSVLTYGMQNRDSGKMLLGIYNSDNTMRNVQIRYSATDQDNLLTHKVIMGVIIAVVAIVCVIFVLAVYINRMMKRRRAAMRMQIERRESELQGILLLQSPPNQNDVKFADALTLEEFEKYFPQKPFEKHQNQFKQTGCSVCLEDFSAETLCYQLYCHHIFHEACIHTWLEKQNSCPACRVPLGKKALEEFFEVQKKQSEVNTPETIEIKIQDQEAASEQDNSIIKRPEEFCQ